MCQLKLHATQACGQPSASSSRLTDFYELDINIRGFPSLAASLVSCSKICMQFRFLQTIHMQQSSSGGQQAVLHGLAAGYVWTC